MPIRDFLQDESGDFAVVDGDFALVGGDTPAANIAAVEQGVRIRLGMFKGECYLDEVQGVDYLGVILVKNPDANEVRSELSAAILDTPDVTSATDAGLVRDGAARTASIEWSATTAYGAASGMVGT